LGFEDKGGFGRRNYFETFTDFFIFGFNFLKQAAVVLVTKQNTLLSDDFILRYAIAFPHSMQLLEEEGEINSFHVT
jgi:hypothetical protein